MRITKDFAVNSEAQKLLDDIKKAKGKILNIFQIMAHSPVALSCYLNFSENLGKGKLTPIMREHIAVVVAGFSKCHYCAAAHTMLLQKQGATEEEAKSNLKAKSKDPQIQALLDFVIEVLQTKGNISDTHIASFRAAGFADEIMIEVIANIAINIFTNYFNNVAQTELDLPKVDLD